MTRKIIRYASLWLGVVTALFYLCLPAGYLYFEHGGLIKPYVTDALSTPLGQVARQGIQYYNRNLTEKKKRTPDIIQFPLDAGCLLRGPKFKNALDPCKVKLANVKPNKIVQSPYLPLLPGNYTVAMQVGKPSNRCVITADVLRATKRENQPIAHQILDVAQAHQTVSASSDDQADKDSTARSLTSEMTFRVTLWDFLVNASYQIRLPKVRRCRGYLTTELVRR
ncbi:MAG: hypothetical protein VKK04_00655 [Synechococcales bacterium]|nr:hypothetical protein [Synechococcales bacterium]